MPREEHLLRQMEWKNTLTKFGRVSLEKSISIGGALIYADVYATIDGREYIIEIGDMADKKKQELLESYGKNQNVIFMHEGYGQDKIIEVLQTISRFRDSPSGKAQLFNLHLQSRKKKLRNFGVKIGLFTYVLNVVLLIFFMISGSPEAMNVYIVFGFVLGWGLYPIIGLMAGSIIGLVPCNCPQCKQIRNMGGSVPKV